MHILYPPLTAVTSVDRTLGQSKDYILTTCTNVLIDPSDQFLCTAAAMACLGAKIRGSRGVICRASRKTRVQAPSGLSHVARMQEAAESRFVCYKARPIYYMGAVCRTLPRGISRPRTASAEGNPPPSGRDSVPQVLWT